MLPNAFVILWNDKPIGLDNNSGGYPFKTEYPGSVHYWLTKHDAQKYLDVINWKSEYHMVIKEIQFRIIDKI